MNILTCSNSLSVWSWSGGELSVSSLHKSKYKRYQGISNPGHTSQPDLYVCILVRGTYLSCDLRSWMRCPLPQCCPGTQRKTHYQQNTAEWQMCEVKKKHLQRRIHPGISDSVAIIQSNLGKSILAAPQDIKKPIRSFHYGGLDVICTSKGVRHGGWGLGSLSRGQERYSWEGSEFI